MVLMLGSTPIARTMAIKFLTRKGGTVDISNTERRVIKTWDDDLVHNGGRHLLCLMDAPGAAKWGKIQTNRRERREKRAELRAELDDYYTESEDD